MNLYAIYSGTTWLFNIEADCQEEALCKARETNPQATHAVLTHEDLSSGR